MKLTEAKQQFISSWGAFGTHWGINRTMAQIHALLLISPDPLTQDDMMEELNISRGNTNMNIRELINWGLVDRVILPGERKEFFTAEKDIWKVVRQIVKERKKRELEPMLKLLDQLEELARLSILGVGFDVAKRDRLAVDHCDDGVLREAVDGVGRRPRLRRRRRCPE